MTGDALAGANHNKHLRKGDYNLRSMPIRVLVAADVDRSFFDSIENDDRFSVDHRRAHEAAALASVIPGHEVLVTRFHNEVTADVIAAAPDLRLIVQGTSGLDNIDHASAQSRNVTVVGIPGENANAVAEIVIGFMLSLTRTIAQYGDEVRAGVWKRDDCATRRELRGYRLGIVGLGRVGGQVARLSRAFGVEPRAYDPYITPETARERGAEPVDSLRELLGSSDILTLHVPLTDETRGMVCSSQLRQLPPGSIVINTSRGPVLDIDAALGALSSRRLGGLAIDVFPDEPPAATDWPLDPQLILTPHIAGCSRESKHSIGVMIYRKICENFGFDPR